MASFSSILVTFYYTAINLLILMAQVWVTASTAAGEGSQSPRLTAVPKPTPSHTPVAVGGGRVWRVGVGSGVTLGCRGLGTPTPTVSWYKDSSPIITGPLTQLLPGGDLHLTGKLHFL